MPTNHPSRATLLCVPALVLSVAVGPARTSAQTTHSLPLAPENIHWGYYDASLEAAVTIRSGDRVSFQNLLARGLDRLRLAGFDESRFTDAMRRVDEAEEKGPGAHPLNGPIHVEGAEPGDVLEVRIVEIGFLADYGVSGHLPGGGTLPTDFPTAALRRFEFDTLASTATMQGAEGVTIPLRPFFGSIGVAPPPLRGRIGSRAPGYHGGNFDNRELVEGTTVYLPVHAPGGMLSIGDGHAAQGDGEVSGTAIETSLYGTIEVVLHRDRSLRWPRAETPTHYVSMGLDPDLDEAARLATREMVDFLVSEKGMAPSDAYILCSVALDLRVTQLVDGTKGVHGMLSRALFER